MTGVSPPKSAPPKYNVGNVVHIFIEGGHSFGWIVREIHNRECQGCEGGDYIFKLERNGIYITVYSDVVVGLDPSPTAHAGQVAARLAATNVDPRKNCGLTDSELRKMQPIGTLIRNYFPNALLAVSAVAWVGNEKHNPGEPLHWAENKSTDHVDCDARHFIDAAQGDGWDETTLPDGRKYAVLHAAEHAWRALAELELLVRKEGEVIRVLNLPKK